jgi:hypothetical protein
MKKLSYLLIAFLILSACTGDEEPTPEPKQDYTSVVMLSGMDNTFHGAYLVVRMDTIEPFIGDRRPLFKSVSDFFWFGKDAIKAELIINDTIDKVYICMDIAEVYDTVFLVQKGIRNEFYLQSGTKRFPHGSIYVDIPH